VQLNQELSISSYFPSWLTEAFRGDIDLGQSSKPGFPIYVFAQYRKDAEELDQSKYRQSGVYSAVHGAKPVTELLHKTVSMTR